MQERIASLTGKRCSAKAVGEYKSLALGFGDEVLRPTGRNPLAVRSEWELGTYTAAWRIVHGNEVLCGSMDPGHGNDELDLRGPMMEKYDQLTSLIKSLRDIDDAAIVNGVSHHFLEFVLEKNSKEFLIKGNKEGLIHFALSILSIVEDGGDGRHVHFDETGIVDRCDMPVVVCFKKAEWDSK